MRLITTILLVQFAVLLQSGFCTAQTQHLDSLYFELASTDDTGSKARIMLEIGRHYNYTNIDSSAYYAHQVINVTSEDRLRAEAFAWLCALYRFVRPDSTFYYGNLALKLANEKNFGDIYPNVFNSLSLTETAIGNLPQALQFALQAVKLAEQQNSKFELGFGLANLGYVYLNNGSYNEAVDAFKKSYNLFNSVGRKVNALISLAFIGQSYAMLNLPD
jgi:tetratricopeptide (TPR) repeat protein